MATRRILLAGLVGGIVLFVWGAISHMVLPLGEMGVKSLPDDAAVMQTLSSSLTEHGFYFFPSTDMSRAMTPEQEAAWTARYKAGPIGILVFQPQGQEPMSATMFGGEILSNILAALIAALIVARMAGSFRLKVGYVALMGLFAWFSLSWSYWSWYAFPTDFILAEGLDQVLGWLIAGAAIVWMLNRGLKTVAVPVEESAEALASSR